MFTDTTDLLPYEVARGGIRRPRCKAARRKNQEKRILKFDDEVSPAGDAHDEANDDSDGEFNGENAPVASVSEQTERILGGVHVQPLTMCLDINTEGDNSTKAQRHQDPVASCSCGKCNNLGVQRCYGLQLLALLKTYNMANMADPNRVVIKKKLMDDLENRISAFIEAHGARLKGHFEAVSKQKKLPRFPSTSGTRSLRQFQIELQTERLRRAVFSDPDRIIPGLKIIDQLTALLAGKFVDQAIGYYLRVTPAASGEFAYLNAVYALREFAMDKNLAVNAVLSYRLVKRQIDGNRLLNGSGQTAELSNARTMSPEIDSVFRTPPNKGRQSTYSAMVKAPKNKNPRMPRNPESDDRPLDEPELPKGWVPPTYRKSLATTMREKDRHSAHARYGNDMSSKAHLQQLAYAQEQRLVVELESLKIGVNEIVASSSMHCSLNEVSLTSEFDQLRLLIDRISHAPPNPLFRTCCRLVALLNEISGRRTPKANRGSAEYLFESIGVTWRHMHLVNCMRQSKNMPKVRDTRQKALTFSRRVDDKFVSCLGKKLSAGHSLVSISAFPSSEFGDMLAMEGVPVYAIARLDNPTARAANGSRSDATAVSVFRRVPNHGKVSVDIWFT